MLLQTRPLVCVHGLTLLWPVCAAAAAEPGEQLLLGQRQLGRGQPQRRGGAAQEVHPRAAGPPADRRVPQHLQRRQRSARDGGRD